MRKVGKSRLNFFFTNITYPCLALFPSVKANPAVKKNNASPGTPPVAKAGLISSYRTRKCELVIKIAAITFSTSRAKFLS